MCWVHRVTRRACFHAHATRFLSRLHPPSVTTSSYPPSALLLLRVPSPRSLCPARLLLRALSFRTGLTCLRVPSLFATSRARSHSCARIPASRYVPSAGFRSLSTVCSARTLAGLFHPAATSRVQLVQGLLSPHSHPVSSTGACPRAVPPRTARQACARVHRTRTSTSRLLSVRRCVRSNPVIHQIRGRFLLRVSLLQVLHPRLSHRLTQQRPLLTLGPKTFACALVPCPCLQRLLSENFGNYVAAFTDLPEFSNLSPKLRFELQPRVAALPSSAT